MLVPALRPVPARRPRCRRTRPPRRRRTRRRRRAAKTRHARTAPAARSPRSTPTPPGSACRCCSAAATPSTPRSRPPPRSASPSRSAPASAVAATSSTTTPKTGKVHTIDGRETAPAAMPHDAFIDPATGKPYNFTPELVTSGVSVGVPGTLATWQRALDRWGTRSLAEVAARRPPGSPATASSSTRPSATRPMENGERFKAFTSTRKLFLRGGTRRASARTFRNPDLADTYDLLARPGHRARSTAARSPARSSDAVRKPADERSAPTCRCRRARMVARRPAALPRARTRQPTHVGYRGLDVYGMAPSSSGGTTVGEALNILERYDLAALPASPGAAPLPRGQRARLRRPRQVRRRPRAGRRPARRPALRRVRRRAGLPDRPDRARSPSRSRPATSRRTTAAAPAGRARRRRPRARHRERQDHQPHRRRQVGQRRRVHAHHRADRRLGHRRARPRLPAQQRADRLHRRLRPRRPQPDRAAQAAAQLDVADDRARGRQAVPRGRLARRLDDHHHGAADPGQPARPRHDPAAGDRGAAGHASATPRPTRPSRPSSTRTAPRSSASATTCATYQDIFTGTAEIGAATGIEFGPRRAAHGRRRAAAAAAGVRRRWSRPD